MKNSQFKATFSKEKGLVTPGRKSVCRSGLLLFLASSRDNGYNCLVKRFTNLFYGESV